MWANGSCRHMCLYRWDLIDCRMCLDGGLETSASWCCATCLQMLPATALDSLVVDGGACLQQRKSTCICVYKGV